MMDEMGGCSSHLSLPILPTLSYPPVHEHALVEAGHGGRGVQDVGHARGLQGGQVAGGADGAWEEGEENDMRGSAKGARQARRM